MSPIRNAPKPPPLTLMENAPALEGSPIKSSPIKARPLPPGLGSTSSYFHSSQRFPKQRRFAKNHGSQALEAVIQSEVEKNNELARREQQQIYFANKFPSPETRGVAAVLGGFSTSSRLTSYYALGQEENTRMGVENILGSNDDWSQASGMQRLIAAGAEESNFMRDHRHVKDLPPHSPAKLSELPAYQVHDGEASGLSIINGDHYHPHGQSGHHGGEQRKSILSSVMEKTNKNVLKRKSTAAFPSTPVKAPPGQGHVLPPIRTPGGYPSSVLPSAASFHLGTPTKEEALAGMGGVTGGGVEERSMNQEFFEYFMSSPGNNDNNRSRQVTTPGRSGTIMTHTSPAKNTSNVMMSPAKIGTSTSLLQYGRISGPFDGCNSLFMGASDFDAVAALKDLSNSAPSTPSKLHRPRNASHHELLSREEAVPCDGGRKAGEAERKQANNASGSRKKPKTSFFGQVKAKVKERKTGER